MIETKRDFAAEGPCAVVVCFLAEGSQQTRKGFVAACLFRHAGRQRLAEDMVIKQIGGEECRKMLAETGFGRLACAKDNQPYVVPIYFACEGENIYLFSTEGKKIEWMRANPKVCLEVDVVEGQFNWKSVIVTGRYRELGDSPEANAEREAAERMLQQRYMAWQAPYQIMQRREDGHGGPAIVFSIRIEEISGLAAEPGPFESAAPF
jgi:nitroimidazol reductase NimA-like FMN-containing flavoprotein (pyridoxamine 5'-phosphate oxidase superfamily)